MKVHVALDSIRHEGLVVLALELVGWRDLAGQLARSQASTHNQKRPHRCVGCTMAALATSLSAIARVSSNAPLKRQQRNQPRGECSNPRAR